MNEEEGTGSSRQRCPLLHLPTQHHLQDIGPHLLMYLSADGLCIGQKDMKCIHGPSYAYPEVLGSKTVQV